MGQWDKLRSKMSTPLLEAHDPFLDIARCSDEDENSPEYSMDKWQKRGNFANKIANGLSNTDFRSDRGYTGLELED
jgi:hypothetical protein